MRVEEAITSFPKLACKVSPTKSVEVKKKGGGMFYFAPQVMEVAMAIMADGKDPCDLSRTKIRAYGTKLLLGEEASAAGLPGEHGD